MEERIINSMDNVNLTPADLIEQVNPIKEGFFYPVFEKAFEEIKNICRQPHRVYDYPLPNGV